jgi:putative copper export protein
MLFFVLVLHLIGASVWFGGHVVLLLCVVPEALSTHDPEVVIRFERPYERVGVPALLLQLITGLWLAHRYIPGVMDAFAFDDPLRRAVAVKLLLLVLTLVTGLHARSRIIPSLTAARLPFLAVHVLLITTLGLVMLVVGAFITKGI